MDRRLRNRILIFLALAAILAFALVRLSGRQPVAKISAVTPIRENVVASISSNGKVEPISPFVVLFAIFFFTFLWGLFGTFIGVPIALAILTFCDQRPSSRWLANLLGGPLQAEIEQAKS